MKFRVSGNEFHPLTVNLFPVYKKFMLNNNNYFTKQVQNHTNNVLSTDDVALADDAVEPVSLFVSFHNIIQLIIALNTLTLKSANTALIIITATILYILNSDSNDNKEL